MQQQHWVLFSVLEAYMYCKKSLEDSIRAKVEETDAAPMRLRQVSHQILQVFASCVSRGQLHAVSADFDGCELYQHLHQQQNDVIFELCQMLLVLHALLMLCATAWSLQGKHHTGHAWSVLLRRD